MVQNVGLTYLRVALFLDLRPSRPGSLNKPDRRFLCFWPHENAESLILVDLLAVRNCQLPGFKLSD